MFIYIKETDAVKDHKEFEIARLLKEMASDLEDGVDKKYYADTRDDIAGAYITK